MTNQQSSNSGGSNQPSGPNQKKRSLKVWVDELAQRAVRDKAFRVRYLTVSGLMVLAGIILFSNAGDTNTYRVYDYSGGQLSSHKQHPSFVTEIMSIGGIALVVVGGLAILAFVVRQKKP